MNGKLIVIEAGDGSGKATQTKLLFDKLSSDNYKVRQVEFPDYGSDSSALIKMYLNGEFGNDPNDVNAYAASSFYAADRFASYKKAWGQFYQDGGIVLADRYTTSNMVHQAAKITDPIERKLFLDWLWDLEFVKFKLPIPDCVIFLDMPPKVSQILINSRALQTDNGEKDIHERNHDYLVHSYNNATQLRESYGWEKVNCVDNGKLRSREDIHKDIYRIVTKVIKT
ncbi:dTMP kinase [Desulfosporosinus meridiei]|uniref:Thymidylate kinase n=1 Tax=Desulfosporosinus meridiei (strain ATCC BAA-275 / DSM 13257 / KCTC 12902 / NCIMB 13706 / S10) TaxID=768704 RepID=J7J0R4_DESMD|nr:thymidylate kinase [Desulfosporosinus meridiei]AFQ44556.1 thymidylate kinase [Desulfosporosinus meridiei DSM 13257]